ncbi:MAG: hypothetical protein JW827_08505 [Spirochaetes bacterium]|nr:hypothetical protein [Spirochaetota bacterium]
MKKLFIIFNVLFLNELLAFSVNPGKFEINCEAGNKVVLKYDLACTKEIPEFIRISYKNIAGELHDSQIEFPEEVIKLEPGKTLKSVDIIINTPMDVPENILKISFTDIPQASPIGIASRISTRAYIRYKKKAKIDYNIESIKLESILFRGKMLNYFVVKIKNNSNVYIRPEGLLILKNISDNTRNTNHDSIPLQVPVNGIKVPVYAGQSRELRTLITGIPDQGTYLAEMKIKTDLTDYKTFRFKIKIYNNEIFILGKDEE